MKYFYLATFLGFLGCSSPEPTHPNVLFILVDDLGWTDLGVYGSNFHETPNIDRLAVQGTRFTNAYSASPVCSPTRAALMTGRHPTRVGITDWIPGLDPKNRPLLGTEDLHALPERETTIAEVFKQKGYKTFFAGKWHLGSEGSFPEDHGFDINIGGHHMGQPPGGYYSPYKNPKMSDGHEGEYLTDRLTDETISFMKESKDQPFFAYLSYYTVHTPIQASKKHLAYFEEKAQQIEDSVRTHPEGDGHTVINQLNPAYASMVAALDENVGRLLRSLEENGLSENTIVVFTSDNGGLTTAASDRWKAPTSVKPLRAGKGWAYEGGIRIPLIIKQPGVEQVDVSNEPVVSMDMFPTILKLTNHAARPDLHVDGLALDRLIHDDQASLDRHYLLWDFPHYHGSAWKPGVALRADDWKLHYDYETEEYELYNLKEDIAEGENQAEIKAELAVVLQMKMAKAKGDLGSKKPTINPDYQP